MSSTLMVGVALMSLSAQAQGGQQRVIPAPKGPTPHLSDGKPDLSGVWRGGGPVQDLAVGLAKGETIPLLPEAEKLMKSRQSKDDPEANCLPTGVPRIAPYPWRILQTPTHVFFLFEGNIHSYRQIFLNQTNITRISTLRGTVTRSDTMKATLLSSILSDSTTGSGSISGAIPTRQNCTRLNAGRERILELWSMKSRSTIRVHTPDHSS